MTAASLAVAGLDPAGLYQDAPTILTGLAAALGLTLSPLFRKRRTILLAQLAAGICFAAHYACLDITAAAATNALGLVQVLAALFAARSATMNRLGHVLICLMVLLSLWFWQGPISALSVTATALIALARMQSDELRLRLLLLVGSGFWTIHDFVGEAWILLAADVGVLLSGVAVLFPRLVRVIVERRRPAPAPRPSVTGRENHGLPGKRIAPTAATSRGAPSLYQGAPTRIRSSEPMKGRIAAYRPSVLPRAARERPGSSADHAFGGGVTGRAPRIGPYYNGRHNARNNARTLA